ncbi:MAG: ATP-binding protein [Polyangiaceae bacterium]|nr:ATP-binding protein [Polyangiaceae bacterium]
MRGCRPWRQPPRVRSARARQITLVCAIRSELVRRGRRVLFTPTYALLQRLLAASATFDSRERETATLDSFDAVILDDIGLRQRNRDEWRSSSRFLSER